MSVSVYGSVDGARCQRVLVWTHQEITDLPMHRPPGCPFIATPVWGSHPGLCEPLAYSLLRLVIDEREICDRLHREVARAWLSQLDPREDWLIDGQDLLGAALAVLWCHPRLSTNAVEPVDLATEVVDEQ